MKDRDLRLLTRRLKSLQHDTLQPENGSAHGIFWQNNTVEQEQNNAITTCIFGWWKALWLQFLRKANFSLLQRNTIYLTIMVVVKQWLTASSIPIKHHH